MLWFVVGGVGSAGMNTLLTQFFDHQLRWRTGPSLAVSFAIMTVFFFLWNYFINFRTSVNWHECLWRYLGSVAVCYGINLLISFSAIKRFGAEKSWQRFLIIAGVLSITGGVKFLLYHFWVFPHGKPAKTIEDQVAA
ncbi:MAG: hypothetical protein QOD99_223 [Chthoniobacter sp.]|nr:hypothetical protein [Chthoniobacter sp.]